MDGFLLIDKDQKVSSFDVVKEIRKLTREVHVGHAGTLDPLATGLLVIGVGEATKLLEYFIGCEKEYEVSACFGKESDTYDADGKIVSVNEKSYHDSEELVSIIREKFIGNISQMPPKYSALKVKGRRACDILRGGGDVELKPRNVHISRFDLKEFDWPNVSFKVKCGSGTYIRSLIHDLGGELKCGAYVTFLRRTKVADFSVNGANKIEKLDDKIDKIEKYLISLEDIGRIFQKIDITEGEYDVLKNGGIIMNKKIEHRVANDKPVMAYCSGFLVGVVEFKNNGNSVKFRKLIVRK